MSYRLQMVGDVLGGLLGIIVWAILIAAFFVFILALVVVTLLESVLVIPIWLVNVLAGQPVLEFYWLKKKMEHPDVKYFWQTFFC